MTSEPPRSRSGPATVATAMIHRPKLCPPDLLVRDVRTMFRDDHVHAVLVADHGTLLTVVERADIGSTPAEVPARKCGRLAGRVVGPDADLGQTWRAMATEQRRRLAVVDHRHVLLGLLCLKRSGRGFCSDVDVAARAAELEQRLPPWVTGDALLR